MVSQVTHPAHSTPVDSTAPSKIDLSAIPPPKGKEPTWEEEAHKHANASAWHLQNRWGLFAWIEFGLKIIGSFVALISLTTISATAKLSLVRIVEIFLFVPLTLGLLIPLIAAYAIKESFDFIYVVITFLAHISIIFVLVYGTTGINVVAFCAMMAVGESFRLVFRVIG